jgi:hypothetical protein
MLHCVQSNIPQSAQTTNRISAAQQHKRRKTCVLRLVCQSFVPTVRHPYRQQLTVLPYLRILLGPDTGVKRPSSPTRAEPTSHVSWGGGAVKHVMGQSLGSGGLSLAVWQHAHVVNLGQLRQPAYFQNKSLLSACWHRAVANMVERLWLPRVTCRRPIHAMNE